MLRYIAERWRYIAVGCVAVVVLAIVVIALLPSENQPLRIYSSLPQREQQQQPLGAASIGAGHNLGVVKNERTVDMENAMRLALAQAGGKAGDFEVAYEPLDDSDVVGESPAALVQANARRAADDDNTAVYIGDFTSDATQQSLPILSRARIPQISVSSTRVGLTKRDPQGDANEPGRYYPPQPGYAKGYRNLVRLIPNAAVHAEALLALMAQTDHCTRVAMINDNLSYGEALANNILAKNDRRMKFDFSESVGPYGRYERIVDRFRRPGTKPDCFVYSGIRNPNTVEIFEAIAGALPTAKLYGANGVVTASFVDPKKGGLSQKVADRVKVMVSPYEPEQAKGFFAAFKDAYDKEPNPYAVYAYEAMQLALDAIADSTSGRRADIRRALFDTSDRQGSVLGSYSITATGDTDIASYGVSRIKDGELTPPVTAPRLRRR